jgi:hypothetical protein
MFGCVTSTASRVANFSSRQKHRLTKTLHHKLSSRSKNGKTTAKEGQNPRTFITIKDDQTWSEADEGEDSERHEHDRRGFKAIRGIPNSKIEAAVLQMLGLTNAAESSLCRITGRTAGSFHLVIKLTITALDSSSRDVILKIPFHGTPSNWAPQDGTQLENEATLMLWIHKKTQIPVPEVLHYHETCDNAVGAPYILMTKLPGKQAADVWFGKPFADLTHREHLNLAEQPSPELEQKRITFLKSLADMMAQLNTLEFDRIGVPEFYKPSPLEPIVCFNYSPSWRWHTKNTMHNLHHLGPFKTSEDFFKEHLDEKWDHDYNMHVDDSTSESDLAQIGLWKILNMIFSSPALTHSPKSPVQPGEPHQESFVLRHDDLSLFNILCAEDGTVTSILDWDGIMAVPRCIGATAMPMFLSRDWLPECTMWDLQALPCGLEQYRTVYADAMEEKSGDGRYTRKSPIYQAAYALVHEDADPEDLVSKLLLEVPEFRRVKPEELLWRLGAGYPAAEELLEEKIAELLMPDE